MEVLLAFFFAAFVAGVASPHRPATLRSRLALLVSSVVVAAALMSHRLA